MNRYAIENLFGIEGLNIAWYGLIIACGMVLGFALGSIKHSLCQFAVRNRAALLFLRKYTAHYSRLTDAAIVE